MGSMTSAEYDRGLEDGAALAQRDAFVLVRALRAENERLRLILAEYADPDNWQDSLTARLAIFTGEGDYGWSLAFKALDANDSQVGITS